MLSWTRRPLTPADVVSPWTRKSSGTTIVEVTWPAGFVAGAGIVLGRSAALYLTVVVGPFWPWPRSTSRPAFWLVSSASPNESRMPEASWIV